GEFHRFVPVMAYWRGFRVTEIKVRHHPRKFGASKFGARRFARGLIDLLNVLFLTTFLRTPLRLFGPLGFWTFIAGVLVDIYVVASSYLVTHEPIHNRPLLFVGILLIFFGVQFILTGPPWLSLRPACMPAHLPGLRVCALYPRQYLARFDPYSLGGKVRRFATNRPCQHDRRTDYQISRGRIDLCPQPVILGQFRGCWFALPWSSRHPTRLIPLP